MTRRLSLALGALASLVSAAAALPLASAPAPPQLVTPYDVVADPAGRIFVADAGRHRVFRYDAIRRRLITVAGNGSGGTRGDGGAALRAQLGELTSLAVDRNGRIYVSDLSGGVVRRFSVGGTISTVARVPGAVGVDVDPTGRFLAIASLERGVLRLDLTNGKLETLVPPGDALHDPHGLAYESDGDLLVADPPDALFRIEGSTGEITKVANLDTARILPTAKGIYFGQGGPSGGRIRLLLADGSIRTVVGTGRVSRQRDGVPATSVGILPTSVWLARDGSLLVTQALPIPALRRVGRNGVISTLAR